MSEEIDLLRKKIDLCDLNILNYLARRMEVSDNIGKIKKENGWDVTDKNREKQLFDNRVAEGKKRNLEEEFVRELYGVIVKYSKKRQNI